MTTSDSLNPMTKEELFAEVKRLETQAMILVGGGSDEEFDRALARAEELTAIAKREGWLP